MTLPYTGRFAPSPSGPLHLGSLVTAVTSFLHARAAKGRWLLRIEDLDRPRCVEGAADAILRCLEAHGLYWDETPLYQSHRLNAYEQLIAQLIAQDQAYACDCSRKMIQAAGGVYHGHCRRRQLPPERHAIRLLMTGAPTDFDDLVLGHQHITEPHAYEDCVIKRRDGIVAYNFAVVVDDIHQTVTHVIRGADLVATTVTQMHIFTLLQPLLGSCQPIRYGHTPLICLSPGQKLSKQNKAPAVNDQQPKSNLLSVFKLLGMSPPADIVDLSCEQMLSWASQCWQPKNPTGQREIIVSEVDCPYHNHKS